MTRKRLCPICLEKTNMRRLEDRNKIKRFKCKECGAVLRKTPFLYKI